MDKETLRKSISLVNQFPYIFDMSIKENLLLAKSDATDKQIKCASFICRELGMNYEPLLKRRTWEFINKYLDDAKQSWETSFECWCEDNSDWLPEYY